MPRKKELAVPFGQKWLATPELTTNAIKNIKKQILVPHPGQVPIIESKARFKVVNAGRRFGKTKIAARALVVKAIEQPGMLGWWIAPEYKNIKRGYAEVVSQIPPILLAKPAPPVTSQNLVLEFKSGSVLEFYSGKNPDAMAGAGVDYAVIDEAALVPHGDDVWNQLVRPTLMDRGGGALFISTPRGKNWFWELFNKGLSKHPSNGDWACWHRTSLDNPTIPENVDDPEERKRRREQEVEEARLIMPEMLFKQEILAEFMSSAASIFNLDTPGTVIESTAEARGSVFVGIDLAKKEDFTVISAARAEDRMPVYHRKFNELKWTDQRQMIHEAIKEIYAAGAEEIRVGIDSTGVGEAIADDLENEGLDVERILFTNQWKERAVGVLSRDFQNGAAHILESARSEFDHYEYEMTAAGNYKFESSVGHDDEVSAKLIEHWMLHTTSPSDIKVLNAPEADKVDTGAPAIAETIEPDDPGSIMANDAAWGDGSFSGGGAYSGR